MNSAQRLGRVSATLLFSIMLLGTLRAQTPEVLRFLHWFGNEMVGGAQTNIYTFDAVIRVTSREWRDLKRTDGTFHQTSHQELLQEAVRMSDGTLRFSWTLSLSQEPQVGEASWSPTDPRHLKISIQGAESRVLDIPLDTVLWPLDEDGLLKEAARGFRPIKINGFAFPVQQFTEVNLEPQVLDPLPGYSDAVRFRGKTREGAAPSLPVDMWISPSAGVLRVTGELGGRCWVEQRQELPLPESQDSSNPQSSWKALEPNPFLPWLRKVTVTWSGDPALTIPEDPQQHLVGPAQFLLRRAALPSVKDRAQMPVQGQATPEDGQFLAATPLVQWKDPVFDGLIDRLDLPRHAGRWEIARRVNAFVYDWIQENDLSVDFATALETARRRKGDCTEHGVLAVALLRRLGVPARGVVGWVASGKIFEPHFWVEVHVGHRWVPLDPTFDQAPASAFRIKLGVTDLSSLGEAGWTSNTQSFNPSTLRPVGPWPDGIRLKGNAVEAPDGTLVWAKGGHWALLDGRLFLELQGRHSVLATNRPSYAQIRKAVLLRDPHHGEAWWSPFSRILLMDLGHGRWIQVDVVTREQALVLLSRLKTIGP